MPFFLLFYLLSILLSLILAKLLFGALGGARENLCLRARRPQGLSALGIPRMPIHYRASSILFGSKRKKHPYGLCSKGQFLNPTGNSTHQQEKDRECFYTLCPLFLTSTAFVVTTAYSEIFCFAKCEIMFCRTL